MYFKSFLSLIFLPIKQKLKQFFFIFVHTFFIIIT